MLAPFDLTGAAVNIAIALAFGYLLGSIPFGLILTRLAGLGDVRSIGSGNIGATNVLRTGRKGLAATTLLLDMLKGTAAALIAGRWGPEFAAFAGLGAFLGHIFPVWLRFKGGKGVATFIGVLFALSWQAGLAFAAIWLASAILTKYSSLSALLATAASPLVLWLTGNSAFAMFFIVMGVILFIKHRANIQRLMAGTEPRIGAK